MQLILMVKAPELLEEFFIEGFFLKIFLLRSRVFHDMTKYFPQDDY